MMEINKEELKYLLMKNNLKLQKLKNQLMNFKQSKNQINNKEEEIEAITN